VTLSELTLALQNTITHKCCPCNQKDQGYVLFQARNKETRNTNLYPNQELMLPPSMTLKEGSFKKFLKIE
jgi:hypothetical protein